MSTPRVTEILATVGLLQSYEFIPAARLAEVRARGSALHKAMEYIHADELDEASLHPELVRPVQAYKAFVSDTGHVPRFPELEVKHPWGFVGHIDRVGSVHDYRTCLIDFKNSDSPDMEGAKYQLAGYRHLYVTEYREPVDRCYVLQLRPDGRYRLHDVTSEHALQVFAAAWLVFQARKELGR